MPAPRNRGAAAAVAPPPVKRRRQGLGHVPAPLFADAASAAGRPRSSPPKPASPPDDDKEPKCAICLENLKETLASAPCGHVFHHACLKASFSKFKYCPRCRKGIKSEKQIQKIFF